MPDNIEKIIKDIDLAMREKKILLTKEDKSRLRLCLKEKKDIQDIIQEIVIKHSFNEDYVLIRKIKD
ncbi:hypothetical protein [Treponema sp. R80B11-R83G3]